LIEPRLDNFAGPAADQCLHNSPATKARLPFAIDSRRHARHAAQRLSDDQRLLVCRRARRPGRLEADIAIAAARRVGLAKIAEDRLLPAFARISEIDHQFQLRPVAPLFFAELGGIELQLRATHIRLEQARPANTAAGNIEAIDVSFAIENMQR
jgi:hypothetical protein